MICICVCRDHIYIYDLYICVTPSRGVRASTHTVINAYDLHISIHVWHSCIHVINSIQWRSFIHSSQYTLCTSADQPHRSPWDIPTRPLQPHRSPWETPTTPLYYQPHIPHRSPWVCLEDKTDLVFVHVCDSIVA